MVVLGVLLLVAALVVAVSIIAGGSDEVSIRLLGMVFDTDARTVYLGGLVSLLVAVVGLALIARGLRRQRSIRRENRSLKREVRAVHESDGPGQDGPTGGAHADDASRDRRDPA